MYEATLVHFHTAQTDGNSFTIYVVSVRKGAAQWQVFRRYREWEDLRMRLIHQLGSAPPMPPKQLWGRMRPEVIENRMLGLNHFLQLCLGTPIYASHRAVSEFLEEGKNVPPEGLDPSLLDSQLDATSAGAPSASPHSQHQQQLKELVEAASAAFITVAQPAPVLDAAYLEERARLYAAAAEDLPPELRPGSSLPLRPPAAAASLDDAAAAAASSALARLLVAQPPAPTQMALARQTAEAASRAVRAISVTGKREILVAVGQ